MNFTTAVSRGEEDVVRKHLANGVDLNITGRTLRTPLSIAAGNGYKVIVEILL
jgi:ankyrin repeat protein